MDLSKLIVPEDLAAPKPIVTCVIEGILDEEDLREIATSAAVATETVSPLVEPDDPTDLKKLRERHHSVARLIAGGMKQSLVAMITGYTESYLSILLNNPSMLELVEMYRIQKGAQTEVVLEKLQTIGLRAVEKLGDKLDKDELNANELLQTAKLGLDRSDFGPSSKRVNINENHDIDHARLRELEAEARRGSSTHIVPTSEVRKALPKPQEDNGSNAG